MTFNFTRIKDVLLRRGNRQDATPAQIAQPGPGWRFKLALTVSLCLPIFLETEDYTIIASAQPRIASTFNRLDIQSYISATYLLASIVSFPIFRLVADVFGRHSAMQMALLVIFIGSALSAGAQNMAMLLAGRGISGVGVAGVVNTYRTLMGDSRSDKNGWQIAMMVVIHTTTWTVGPFIGAALRPLSFRWVFAINLPCCTTAAALCFFLLHGRVKKGQESSLLPSNGQEQEGFVDKLLRIDWPGVISFLAGGAIILIALNWGSTGSWRSFKTILAFVVGTFHLGSFVTWECILQKQRQLHKPSVKRMMRADPLISFEIFRSYNVCACLYSCFMNGMIELVMLYFFAIFTIVGLGLVNMVVGLPLAYFMPGMGGGSLISILVPSRFVPPQYMVVLGGMITTAGIGLVSITIDRSTYQFGWLALTGLGVGLGSGSIGVYIRLSPRDRQVAVAPLTLVARALGGMIGLAQCGTVMNSKVVSQIASVVRSGTLSPTDIAALGFTAEGWSSGLSSLQSIHSLPAEIQIAVLDAFRIGVRYSFISLLPWCGISVVMTLFLSRIPRSAPEEVPLGGLDDDSDASSQASQTEETREFNSSGDVRQEDLEVSTQERRTEEARVSNEYIETPLSPLLHNMSRSSFTAP